MNAESLVAKLLAGGVELWVEEGGLAYRAPEGVMSGPLREVVAAQKEDIIRVVGEGARLAAASSGQQRMWFLDAFEDDKVVYNLPALALSLRGPLDVDLLQQAIDQLVARHESLRTGFRVVDGVPVQAIAHHVGTPLVTHDLTALSDAEKDIEATRLANEAAREPFNLTTPSLVRPVVLHMDDDEHRLLLPVHHIIADGLALTLLLTELKAAYEGLQNDSSFTLESSPYHYRDFVRWQIGREKTHAVDAHLNYWKEQLQDAPVLLDLPTDSPMPRQQKFDGDSVSLDLSPKQASALIALSKAEGTTPYAILLSLFAILLKRFSGANDLVVGVPVAGRPRKEFTSIVGLFVNTLALRIQVNEDDSFRTLTEQIRATIAGALDHQEAPFDRVIDVLQSPRSTSHPPVFQIMFVDEPVPDSRYALGAAEAEELLLHHGKTKFALTLFSRVGMENAEHTIRLRFEYNVSLFRRATIEMLTTQFKLLVDAFTKQPESRLADFALPLNGLPVALEGPRLEVAKPLPVVFAEIVARYPDDPAVLFEGRTLSYIDLDRKSSRLAGRLQECGVGPEALVPILMNRSQDLLVALLAVWKAGAAYVPFDTKAPVARLTQMLADISARVVITDQECEAKLEDQSIQRVYVDEESGADYAPVTVKAGMAAYVLYTSGSTGTPKGVVVEHRNLANYVAGIVPVLDLPRKTQYAYISPFSADLGNTALFAPLCTGGTIHVISETLSTSADRLAEYMSQHSIEFMKIVPSHLRALMSGSRAAELLPKTCLVLAGEPLPWDLHDRVLELSPKLRVMNHYGPTETTVAVITHELAPMEKTASATVPLTTPIANAEIYVLDDHQRPTPAGTPGEVYIAGPSVARGYLNDEVRTAKSFVQVAVDSAEPKRMYRTGDRARRLASGGLEILGRVDQQVKIRGYRVELGEIESTLLAHPEVAQCAVALHENASGPAQLIAYYVPAQRASLDSELLRDYSKKHLTDAMIPALFVPLEELPLSPNGKLNRRALPKPTAKSRETTIERPFTDTERCIADIWQRAIGVDKVLLDDNFIDLGGHSLLAIEVTTRLSEAIGHPVSLRAIFEEPTVADLARRMDHETRDAPSAPIKETATSPLVVTIQRGTNDVPFFCISPAGGTAFPYYALAHHMGDEQRVYCLQDPANGKGGVPCKTIEEMASLYIEAIKSVQPSGPYHFGGWSFGGMVAYEVAQQLRSSGDALGVVALFETHAPVNATRYRWADVGANLKFLLEFGRSCVETMRDFFYISTDKMRRTASDSDSKSLFSHVRTLWLDSTYQSFLKKARLAEVVAQNEELLSIRHPSTQQFLKIARANLKASMRYSPKPYPGPLTLFMASEQAKSEVNEQSDFGWRSFVPESLIDIHTVEGDHFSIMRHPKVEPFAHQLRTLVDEANAELHS